MTDKHGKVSINVRGDPKEARYWRKAAAQDSRSLANWFRLVANEAAGTPEHVLTKGKKKVDEE